MPLDFPLSLSISGTYRFPGVLPEIYFLETKLLLRSRPTNFQHNFHAHDLRVLWLIPPLISGSPPSKRFLRQLKKYGILNLKLSVALIKFLTLQRQLHLIEIWNIRLVGAVMCILDKKKNLNFPTPPFPYPNENLHLTKQTHHGFNSTVSDQIKEIFNVIIGVNILCLL